jgi:hypothetical protein
MTTIASSHPDDLEPLRTERQHGGLGVEDIDTDPAGGRQ